MKKNEHEDLEYLMTHGSQHQLTYAKLAKKRTLFVSEDVNDNMAAQLSAMLLYLNNVSKTDPIRMYIHTNGGASTGLTNIYDVMQLISAPIETICLGKCYSAGAILLAAGTSGLRFGMKNCSVMIHGVQATFPIPGHDIHDSKDYYKFLKESNDNVIRILANHTKQPFEKVREDCKKDVWLTCKEAIEYGIIDYEL